MFVKINIQHSASSGLDLHHFL